MMKMKRWMAWLCAAMLVFSTLPLYAISIYNHPYYDDYGFSAEVHRAWQETGSMTKVLSTAVESARNTRQTWQGTYTVTLLTNLQPGLFDESLYWIGNVFLLTVFIACFAFFLMTVCKRLGMEKYDRISLTSLALVVMIQFMPDVGEAFYWFNGGIAYVFVYALLALTAALMIRWLNSPKQWLLPVLAILAVLLGGGTYGCGLFAMCLCACVTVWLLCTKHPKRWWFIALECLFAACFLYNMSAPGNAARAWMIGYRTSAVKAVLQSLYYGVQQMGLFIRLPLMAVTLAVLPALYEAAKNSQFGFKHPWLALMIMTCLFCTQFTPPLYSIASIGAGRIINTYFVSFVTAWFLYIYYLCGYVARHCKTIQLPSLRQFIALLLTALCLFGVGSLGFKRDGDVLYGAQNLSGPSALLSILNGEAAQYDREMKQRETLLNDQKQPVVTLSPLTATPSVFMDDLLTQDAIYDVRPTLCDYYGKDAILLTGEADE